MSSKNQTVYRAYKVELKLNNRQRTLCYKHAGCARFAFNWGLQRKIDEYKRTGKSPSSIDLHRELNKLKKTEFPWMYEVSKCAPQEALRNLDNAFRHFFNRVKRGEKPGFPKFKSRKWGVGSFRLTGVIRVFNKSILLPRLGKLQLKEAGYLRSESASIHILSATVSEKAGRWYVSLQVKEKIEVKKNTGPIVGVDLGVQHLATISDGTVFECSKALGIYERKIKRLQRSLSRKQRGSHNQRKIKRKLQKLHARVVNVRRDTIHKVTTILAKTKSIVVIEDLNVNVMRQNHLLAKSVSDAGLYEFRRQLEYKTSWYGCELRVIPRFFPSSKRCSKCGFVKKELPLSTRVFHCEQCGFRINRDLNASHNLLTVAASSTETLNACMRREVTASRQCPSMMQEPNIESILVSFGERSFYKVHSGG